MAIYRAILPRTFNSLKKLLPPDTVFHADTMANGKVCEFYARPDGMVLLSGVIGLPNRPVKHVNVDEESMNRVRVERVIPIPG